ncbi:MAG TPA: PH domain-containing protein [Woeseiaceae bacterium]|nr:PH domain-containing protein [Woeseiaceae bacterium]
MFDNPEIPLEDLPTAEGLQWQPLHDRYVRQLQVMHSFYMLVLIVALGIFGMTPLAEQLPTGWIWALLTIIAVISLAWPGVDVPRRGWVLREKDIVYRTGVLWQTVTAVPFNRIQHAETSSDPLGRRFGTAALELFTAGGSGGDLRIRGLPAGTAERLREKVMAKIGAAIEED